MKYDQCNDGWSEGLVEFSENMKNNHGRDITGHNIYLLQTVDCDGNITGEAYGINVFTDIGLQQLCSNYIYISNCSIYIGKGEGTPTLSDTTLFDKITAAGSIRSDYGTGIRQACKYDKTTGIWTGYRGYYQGYFDYNISGITKDVDITELGFGSNVTNLYTHALVYDPEGNVSPITKRMNERLYITVQFCANIDVNLIKKLWDQKQYLLAQPSSFLYIDDRNTYHEYLHQQIIYGDPKSRTYIDSNYQRYPYPTSEYTMFELLSAYNKFTFNDHIEKCNSVFSNGILFENKYSLCTKTISIFERHSTNQQQCQYLDNNQYSLTTLENLDEPEELVSRNIWTNLDCKSNKLNQNFGHYWVNSNYGRGYLPVTNFKIKSLRMYNHQTKAWDIEEDFTQLSPNTFENSFVDPRLPIYVSLNGKSATYYVTQNITTDVAVTSFSNTGVTIYATDEYWDTDTWEIIGNLLNVEESLQHKKYYISTSSDVLNPTRTWDSLPAVIPSKFSYTFQARTRADYLNILSNEEKGCVMLADQIIYPELTKIEEHTIAEGKCSIYLFTVNNGNLINGDKNPNTYWGYGKLYSFDIYEENVLVRHFVPCYKLNADSSKKYGLYETKLQKFHPFVGNLQYTSTTNSTAYRRQGAEIDPVDSEIPTDQQDEYKQIEYLLHISSYYNSSNTSDNSSTYYGYIDTEYVHKTTTKVIWDGEVYRNYNISYNALFGSRWLNQHRFIFYSNYNYAGSTIQQPHFDLNHYSNTLPNTMTLGTRIKIEAGCLDHEQISHGCNIYNQSTNQLIDATGKLIYSDFSYASYITNNSYGYTRRWAMGDKFITIGNSYGNQIEFYNIPNNPSEEVVVKAVLISEFTDTNGAEYKYYTFSGEDTGYLTIQRLGYNDCAIVNCNDDTPEYRYLINTQKCTAILQTKYCVYRTTTNATTLEFEIYDMENNMVVDTFALPAEGYSLLWIVGWKNRIYIEVTLNGVSDLYYYDMNTKQLRHVVGTSIPALTTNYSSFNQYFQYINVIANDEMLIISNANNSNQLHKIHDSEPLTIYTPTRATSYLAGRNGLQLKYLDNKKHLLLLFAYYSSSSKYAYVEDVGMYMDGANKEYTYPTYHFIGGSNDSYGGTQDIIAGFFKNGVIINETNTSTYTWTPIEYWLPHEMTGTTTSIQSYNNPRELYGKAYEFKLTNDTAKFDDE